MGRRTALYALFMFIIAGLDADHVGGDKTALQRHALPADIAKRRQHFINQAMRESLDCATDSSAAWIREYAAWHAEALKDPKTAKFLLFFCQNPQTPEERKPRDLEGIQQYPCGGAGDRIRAMVEMLRLAAYSKRVLLLYWSTPIDIEEAFAPAAIDWRLQESYGLSHEKDRLLWQRFNNRNETWPPEVVDGSWKTVHANRRLIAISTNLYDPHGDLHAGPNMGARDSQLRSCAFRALFRPSVVVAQRVEKTRKQLFGSRDADYVALHLRMGGMANEKEIVLRFDQMKGLMTSLLCGRDLSNALQLNQSILVITDNALLRYQVASDFYNGVVGPRHIASHLDKPVQPGNGTEAGVPGEEEAYMDMDHLGTFVDLALLADARCFVGSPSGFSSIAMMWGDHQCLSTVTKCLETYGMADFGASCTTLGRRALRESFEEEL